MGADLIDIAEVSRILRTSPRSLRRLIAIGKFPKPIAVGRARLWPIHTVPEVARLYRVSEDRMRAWIRRGALAAVNTRDQRCSRPRFVILPTALADFERRRQVAAVKSKPRRRAKKLWPDYFPDY